MDKRITFGYTETEKFNFHHRKNLFIYLFIYFVFEVSDIDNIQVSSMVSFSEKNYKCFIGYKDGDHKIKPLRIMLSKTSVYVKNYDGKTKWMYFFIRNI